VSEVHAGSGSAAAGKRIYCRGYRSLAPKVADDRARDGRGLEAPRARCRVARVLHCVSTRPLILRRVSVCVGDRLGGEQRRTGERKQ
jgi:hypothetical protein